MVFQEICQNTVLVLNSCGMDNWYAKNMGKDGDAQCSTNCQIFNLFAIQFSSFKNFPLSFSWTMCTLLLSESKCKASSNDWTSDYYLSCQHTLLSSRRLKVSSCTCIAARSVYKKPILLPPWRAFYLLITHLDISLHWWSSLSNNTELSADSQANLRDGQVRRLVFPGLFIHCQLCNKSTNGTRIIEPAGSGFGSKWNANTTEWSQGYSVGNHLRNNSDPWHWFKNTVWLQKSSLITISSVWQLRNWFSASYPVSRSLFSLTSWHILSYMAWMS